MKTSKLSVAVFALVLGLALSMAASAQETDSQWRQLTKVSFDQPVQIPGHVLPAGTYWFKLEQPSQDSDNITVLDQDNKHIIATVRTSSATRVDTKMNNKTQLSIAEPAHGPAVLMKWFYPTDNIGHQFTYPKGDERQFREEDQLTIQGENDGKNGITFHIPQAKS